MQGALSQLRSWKLDHNQEDIRGWALRDPEGHVLGTVGELIVDTDTKHVTQVVLGDGTRYPAHDILLGEHTLTLERSGAIETHEAPATRDAPAERTAEPISETRTAEAPITGEVVRHEPAHDAPVDLSEAASGVADLVIPVVEEEISVEKRVVPVGGMHVETHIVEEPFDQELRLREESLKVDRRRIDEPLSAEEAEARLREGVVEVTATSERAIVDKKAHVVEEVLLKKDSEEHVEHVRDTLRHTEVDVKDLSPAGSKLEKGVKS